ncbi:MAG TPA: nucleoside-diphosphate sugar epimerase, partial [Verrucomicrobiae bacterium]|nr:nucleoside-diphosphate sugar epimerase [Verrucomicrobiae bacterium]
EALVRLQTKEAALGQIFNVGSTAEISIGDLARRVIELTGSKSEITLVPYQEAYLPGFEDMLRRKPVIEKLRQVTGFTPAIQLDEIIRSIAAELCAPPS